MMNQNMNVLFWLFIVNMTLACNQNIIWDKFTGPISGEISSPGYPDLPYPSDLYCVYTFTAPPGIKITINVDFAELEYDPDINNQCYFDYLQIKIPNLSERFGEYKICEEPDGIEPLVTHDGFVELVFESDASTEKKGFHLFWEMEIPTFEGIYETPLEWGALADEEEVDEDSENINDSSEDEVNANSLKSDPVDSPPTESNETSANSNRSLAIGLGVSLPLFLILGIALVYYLYKRNTKNKIKDSISEKEQEE